LDRAKTVAQSIPNNPTEALGALHEKVVALVYIASGLGRKGEIGHAEKILAEAESTLELDPGVGTGKAHLFADVGDAWKQLGCIEQAVKLWRKGAAIAQQALAAVPPGYIRADEFKALSGIIFSVAKAGEIERAKEMVEDYVEKVGHEFMLERIEKLAQEKP
jgi:hypothetical protein